MKKLAEKAWSTGDTPKVGLTVKEIAERIAGIVHGDSTLVIYAVKPLESATREEISFLSPTSPKQTLALFTLAKTTKAGVLLISKFEKSIPTTQIVTPHPLAAIIKISSIFYDPPTPAGIHQTAIIDSTATLAENVSVGAYSVIGAEVELGAKTIIHPHVVIYPKAVIGENCLIHSGAIIRESVRIGNDCVIQNGVVIGGDGFGYTVDEQTGRQRIPHTGNVVLQDNVDVGANSTIDRATFGETRIEESTKIDNLVMIGHNVKVGCRSFLCGQVGIAGSTIIGKNVTLAGQVGVGDHIRLGDNVRVAGGSVVTHHISASTDVAGYPAIQINLWRRRHALLKKLPELFQRLKSFEKKDKEH